MICSLGAFGRAFLLACAACLRSVDANHSDSLFFAADQHVYGVAVDDINKHRLLKRRRHRMAQPERSHLIARSERHRLPFGMMNVGKHLVGQHLGRNESLSAGV